MSKKIYRVMIELQAPIGDYDYVTGDNGIAYIKDFEDIESALEDYYDVVKVNDNSDYVGGNEQVITNYKGYLRYKRYDYGVYENEKLEFWVTLSEIDEPIRYKCEPMFTGRDGFSDKKPTIQIELFENVIEHKHCRYGNVVRGIWKHVNEGLVVSVYSKEAGLHSSCAPIPLDPDIIKSVNGPWSLDEVKDYIKKMLVEHSL